MTDFKWIDHLKEMIKRQGYVGDLDQFYKVLDYILDRGSENEAIAIETVSAPSFSYYSIEQDFMTNEMKMSSTSAQVLINPFSIFMTELDDYIFRLVNEQTTDKQAMRLLLGQQPIEKIILFLHSYSPANDSIRYYIVLNEKIFVDEKIQIWCEEY